MSDDLFQLVAPVYRHALDVVEAAARGSHRPLDEVQAQLIDRLDRVQAGVRKLPGLAPDHESIDRALVYWIDEILVNSPWNDAANWEAVSLEWQGYHENLRAHNYFTHADRAIERERSTEALELYLLGVALGFRGEYRHELRGLVEQGQRYYRRYRDRNTLQPFATETRPGRPLEPLPGPTVLLAVAAMVLLTAIVTLFGFWATHPPSIYHA